MDNFGKKLLEARQNRGLELDQVARETNISARYLLALENEDFAVLPAEPYLLGFLRNYCEYLGLNSAEFISAYKNIKIQEAPVPLKDLIPKRRFADSVLGASPAVRKALFFIPLTLLLLGGGFVLGYYVILPMYENRQKETLAEVFTRTPVQYEFHKEDKQLRGQFYSGDSILVTSESNSYSITFNSVAPSVHFTTAGGSWAVELGQDLTILLSEEENLSLSVFVANLYKKDPSKGAEIHFVLIDETENAKDLDEFTETEDISLQHDSSRAIQQNNKQQVLFEGGSAYPVTLNATFRGYCLFRYESDRTTREERYYQKSDLLTVQAKNGLRIWASNGNAVKFQIVAGGKTVDLEVSRPGEVIVKDMKWIIDEETGRYKFVVMDID